MEKILPWLKRHRRQVAVAAVLAIVAALAGLYHLARSEDPAERAVRSLFAAVGDGQIDEALGYVDPESSLARFWNENRDGVQDRVREALAGYDVDFELKLETVSEGKAAEVSLVGGTVKVGSRQEGTSGAAMPFSLSSLNLVFYLEHKDGRWLVTGINYEDLGQLIEGLRF